MQDESALAPRVVAGVRLAPWSVREVRRRFRALLAEGARLAPAGLAAEDPELLLDPITLPSSAVELFDHVAFLSAPLFDDHLGFMVAFLGRREGRARRVRTLYPRIFYKDVSLVWRAATHVVHDDEETWIGKGEVRRTIEGDEVVLASAEETTDLPYELQGALDEASRRRKPRRDDCAALLVLRHAPRGRLAPYSDFTRSRRRDAARLAIHGGRPIARFRRPLDPTSLVFARGYSPDFARGVVERTTAASHLYGGEVVKTRILAQNREIQYQFAASPTHVWINPPQTLTSALTPFGTRTVDVKAPEDLFVPGFEYHFLDASSDPPELHSQIPKGFAGAPSREDPMRADASAWIERLPPVVEFRRLGLDRRR